MENEIKVGEYGRTNLGKIIKFAWLEDEKGKKYENKVILVDLMLKETYPYYYFKKGEYIVKHSPNLIDILECGDYINGHKIVNEIWGEDDNNLYFEIEGGYNKARYIGENEIKKVVTKEQFEAIGYKVTKM